VGHGSRSPGTLVRFGRRLARPALATMSGEMVTRDERDTTKRSSLGNKAFQALLQGEVRIVVPRVRRVVSTRGRPPHSPPSRWRGPANAGF
jgi:hypothetical protein